MCLAVPGRIVETQGDEPLSRMGRVDFGGVSRQVSLAVVPEANVGDYVLVHVGMAICRMREEHALEVLETLGLLDDSDEEAPG